MISTCSSAPAEQLPLKPGHRYVIGLDDEPADTVSDGRAVVFATSADGDRLQAERTRWADAVAHQNPERTADCQDAVNVP